MDLMEKQFLALLRDLTDNRFYVPTYSHSSGFNECYLINLDDEVFLINEEGEEKELTFNEIISQYPKITLSKRYAFECKFETWDRFKEAIDGKIKINIVEI